MNFSHIEEHLQAKKIPLAVCMPEEKDSITALYEAYELGFIDPILVGSSKKITEALNLYTPGFQPDIINAETPEEAAFKTVELVRSNKVSAVMKGNISTPILLKAVLNSETGIKASDVLSHVLVFQWKGKLRFLTDGGMIPCPSLKAKAEMIKSTAAFAQKLGFKKVKAAVLTDSNEIDLSDSISTDAAVLAQMAAKHYFGENIEVEGPVTLSSAQDADIFIAPNIEAGNTAGKAILYYGNVPAGGMIIGAKVPVIMLSRADTAEIRLNSIKIALAAGSC